MKLPPVADPSPIQDKATRDWCIRTNAMLQLLARHIGESIISVENDVQVDDNTIKRNGNNKLYVNLGAIVDNATIVVNTSTKIELDASAIADGTTITATSNQLSVDPNEIVDDDTIKVDGSEKIYANWATS